MKTNDINKKISRYIRGEMHSDEKKSFQDEMEKDEFLRESVQGYLKSGAHPEEINRLKPKPRPSKFVKITLVSAVSVAAGLALLFLFNFFAKKDENKFYDPDKISLIYTEYDSPEIIQPKLDTITETVYEDTSFYADSYPDESENDEINFEKDDIPPLYRKPPKKLAIQHKELFSLKWEASSNHLYGYLGDFKVVDYRIDNRRNRKNFTIPEAKFDKDDYSSDDREIKYYDFLASALEKYQKSDYKSALNDFRIILNQYPDDLNAIFYAGMCHYKMGNYDKGINVMNRVVEHPINTFDSDAQWYEAMAYKEMEHNKRYRELLTAISTDDTYYGVKAGGLLKKLDELEK